MKCHPGDVMVFLATGYVTPVFAAERLGMIPMFIDVDPDTMDPDAEQLESLCKCTLVRAFNLVSNGGRIPSNIAVLQSICDKYNVALIDDAAHSFGSQRTDPDGTEHYGGLLGRFGVFSFFATKAMTTGEGGALVSQYHHEAVADAEMYARHGKSTQFGADSQVSHVPGYSCRFSEIDAAIGCATIRAVPDAIERRAEIAQIYQNTLSEHFHFFDYGKSNYYKLPVTSKRGPFRADDFTTVLAEDHAIQLSGKIYPSPVYRHPAFKHRFNWVDCPGAAQWSANHVCLPMHEFLTNHDVTRVITATREYFKDN